MDDENTETTEDPTTENTVVLSGGSVAYSLGDAAESIDAVIEALEAAKRDGAEFVVMGSGNYRGAQWASVGSDWSWAGDE